MKGFSRDQLPHRVSTFSNYVPKLLDLQLSDLSMQKYTNKTQDVACIRDSWLECTYLYEFPL